MLDTALVIEYAWLIFQMPCDERVLSRERIQRMLMLARRHWWEVRKYLPALVIGE